MAEITPKQIIETSLEAVDRFQGSAAELEAAIGALVTGRPECLNGKGYCPQSGAR